MEQSDEYSDGLAGEVGTGVTPRLQAHHEVVTARQVNTQQLIGSAAYAQPRHLNTPTQQLPITISQQFQCFLSLPSVL